MTRILAVSPASAATNYEALRVRTQNAGFLLAQEHTIVVSTRDGLMVGRA